MERIIQGLNRIFHGNKRQMLTALAAVFIVYVLVLSGIFSYFHSKDAVANRFTAPQGSVTITEPDWDATGQYMAAKQEPGMRIPKDPTCWNNGNVNVYIRLKMTVSFERYQGTLTESEGALSAEQKANGEIGIPDDAEKLRRVLEQIRLVDTNGEASPFMIRQEGGWICRNPGFICEQDAEDPNTFYFYFTNGEVNGNDEPLMSSVAPDHSTSELFQRVDIPIYKKDYLGVFDSPYSITVVAEGIPADNYSDGLKQSAAAAEFK